MKQQAIKVLSPEHGKRVIEYFKGKGYSGNFIPKEELTTFENVDYIAVSENYMFGATNGFFDRDDCTYEIITLPEETNTMTAKEKPYPKMMRVCHIGDHEKRKALVLDCINGVYIADEEAKDENDICLSSEFKGYDYAEDIPEKVKVTREEIAEWKGISLDQLEIE